MSPTYTRKQVAERLGVSPVTIMKWRHAGKIPPPIPTDDAVLRWTEEAVSEMDYSYRQGGLVAGEYPVEHLPRIKRSAHIQFRGGHLTQPLRERTLPGESISHTVRWITEQYLAAMATIEAAGNTNAIKMQVINDLITADYHRTEQEEAAQ